MAHGPSASKSVSPEDLTPASGPEFDRVGVVSIQGGGIYGLSMLGQLQAVEDLGVKLLAYAGTSAGAIVATLAWAGYTPREILEKFDALAVDRSPEGGGAYERITDLVGAKRGAGSAASGRRFRYDDFERMAKAWESVIRPIGAALDREPAATSLRPLRGDGRDPIPRLAVASALVAALVLLVDALRPSDGPCRLLTGPFGFAIPFLVYWLVAPACVTSLRSLPSACKLLWGGYLGDLVRAVRPAISQGLMRRGFFDGDALEHFIDGLLKESPRFRRLPAAKGEGYLKFEDVQDLVSELVGLEEHELLERRSELPGSLILTATNVSTGELVVFDSHDEKFAPIPIAKAVRASAGFPVFLRPVDFSTDEAELRGWYVDGGVIANFPAWLFSRTLRDKFRERVPYQDLAVRPWIHFGLRVVDRRPGESPPAGPGPAAAEAPPSAGETPASFLTSMFRFVRGQVRDELERRLADRLPRIRIVEQPIKETGWPAPSPGRDQDGAPGNPEALALLDLSGLTADSMRSMFDRGHAFAAAQFGALRFDLPPDPGVVGVMQRLVDLARAALGFPPGLGGPLLRANIYLPSGDMLVRRYDLGADPDMHDDRDMKFSYTSGLTGRCLVNRRPFVCNLEYTRLWARSVGQPDAELLGMRPAEHGKILGSQTWLASFPIFDPSDCWPLGPAQSRLEEDEPADPIEPGQGDDLDDRSYDWGVVWADVPATHDGAVHGVLNLDIELDYDGLKIDPKAERALTDPRIGLILASMKVASMELGRLFSGAIVPEIS